MASASRHAGPDRGEAGDVDEDEGDHLRIDDIVVIMMILVQLRRTRVAELIPNS